MENPTYAAIARQVSLLQQLDMTANNLANTNTPGFRADRPVFREYLTEVSEGEKFASVYAYGDYVDPTQGAMQPTENPLDVGIEGEGYFAIAVDGQGARLEYSRNGGFQLNGDGTVVNHLNFPVMGTGGLITLDIDGGPISISADGSISQGDSVVGQLRIVQFADPRLLEKSGNGLYRTTQAPQDVPNPRLLQGHLESSNVEPVSEVTSLISLHRQFEMSDRMLEEEHKRVQRVINELGRVER